MKTQHGYALRYQTVIGPTDIHVVMDADHLFTLCNKLVPSAPEAWVARADENARYCKECWERMPVGATLHYKTEFDFSLSLRGGRS